jgi:hypothetical protein
MVDLDWGTTLDHLIDIMSNNVATKLFSTKSVLVLGPEYFPPPAKGKKVHISLLLSSTELIACDARVPLALVTKNPAMVVGLFRVSSCLWALLVWKLCPNSSTPLIRTWKISSMLLSKTCKSDHPLVEKSMFLWSG